DWSPPPRPKPVRLRPRPPRVDEAPWHAPPGGAAERWAVARALDVVDGGIASEGHGVMGQAHQGDRLAISKAHGGMAASLGDRGISEAVGKVHLIGRAEAFDGEGIAAIG